MVEGWWCSSSLGFGRVVFCGGIWWLRFRLRVWLWSSAGGVAEVLIVLCGVGVRLEEE